MVRKPSNTLLLLLSSSFILLYMINDVESNNGFAAEAEYKIHQFPPCAACKILVNSFKHAMEKTRHEKFDGGDSAWEKDKLGSYATSETRFIEIQERLCTEVEHGETQCQALAEELENKLEDWWFHHQKNHPDIFDFICIQQTARCCPKDHFGSQCTPCPGFPGKVCNNNGKCKGAGTRKGNGGCFCNKGYGGDNCSQCASGFYESYRDSDKLLCSPCHAACDGPCRGPGPKNCDKCSKGWHMVDGQDCVDIDECVKNDDICSKNQFCVNKDGGYACLNCDKACNGCTGDGPDMCLNCAEGYQKRDNICMNSDILGRKWRENFARFATYFGLCIATCIIFQRNVYIASVIGLLVAVYISVSEYMILHGDIQDTAPNVNIFNPL